MPSLADSKRLERRIEDAVRCADVAWSYYDRLFLCGPPGESPFQLRRARVDAAQRRFAVAAAKLERQASSWIAASEFDPSVDDQAQLAVRRMQTWLSEQPVPARFPVGEESSSINTTVDMLENALANLRQRRVRGAAADPFRRVSGGPQRQDVTRADSLVSPRHHACVTAPPPR